MSLSRREFACQRRLFLPLSPSFNTMKTPCAFHQRLWRCTLRAFRLLPTVAALLSFPVCGQAAGPVLTVELVANEVVISWPASASQYQLEQTEEIALPISWSLVTNPPSLVGAQLQVLLPVAETNRFFRLRLTLPPEPPFNTLIDFNLAMEDAANPSCGCDAQPAYSQGISLTAERCAECEGGVPIPGIMQDTGDGQVFLHNGEFVHRAVDMEIPSRGFNWRLERVFRSGITFDGPLGRNWEFSHNRRLVVETNGNVLRMDGSGRADRYLAQTNGSYAAPRGFYTKLLQNQDGTFTERDRHGAIVDYSAPGSNNVARMTELRDRNGNTMRFEYDGLNRLVRADDSFDRQIDYRYDSNSRLSEVEDFTGRKVTYQYDSFGNLTSVTSPAVTNTPNGNDFPAGKTTRYTYSSGFSDERLNHNLLTITAPNEAATSGPPRVVLEYDTNAVSTHLDRLLRLTLGGTNDSGVAAGGTMAYQYQSLGTAPSNDFAAAVFQTTVTDRNGNLAEYQFNQLGNVVRLREFSNRDVRPGDPAFFETRFEYSAEGEMTRAIQPEGDSVEFTYDTANADRFQQGNLLQTRRVPDGARGGDQTQLVRTHTYEPLYNKMRTMTEPRGNDAAYVPQNGGANSAGRYTTTDSYDYQESSSAPTNAAPFGITIPPALLSLGDLNGDGQTNQNGGNLVRSSDPTVNLLPGSNQALAEGDTAQDIVTRNVYNQFGQMTRMEDPRGNTHLYSYYPENDPDGDGLNFIAGNDTTTGGYLAATVRDAIIGPNRQDTAPLTMITNRYELDQRGNMVARTDGRGLVHRYTYNALNQAVQEEKPKVDPSQSHGYLRQYFYDANDNLVRTDVENVTTDPDTHLPMLVGSHSFFQHTSVFDILNQLVEETKDATRDPAIDASSQPQLLTSRYRYDANGNVVQMLSPLAVAGVDANNYETRTYDERDLLHQTTRGGASLGASTYTYDYDRNRNRVRWTDAENNDATPGAESEVTAYDGFDRRKSVIDRTGNEQRYSYDAAGNVIREEAYGSNGAGSVTNVLLRRTLFAHDELRRQFQMDRQLFLAAGVTQLVSTALSDGPLTPGDGYLTERYEYDALGRLTFRVEDAAAVYRHQYDGASRRITEILPLADTVTAGGPYPTQTAFQYDANDNLIRRVDTHTTPDGFAAPFNETRLFVYDALNRLVRATDALGQTHYTEYDSRGNIVAFYDARGLLISDPLGLYTSRSINHRGNVTRYAYDGLSRRWRDERELTTTGNGGAPRNLTNAFNADGLVVTGTEYDANSRVASRADDLTNRTVYAYDALNRLVAQTNADGGTRTPTYDRDHNPTTLLDENNTLHTYVYDTLSRRVSHTIAPDNSKTNSAGLPLLVGTTFQTYAYDGLSRLIRGTDNNDPATTNDDWTVTTVYDSLNRMVEEVQNGRPVSSGYVSDDRVDLHYPGAGRVVHYAYDAHHQLTAVSNFTLVAINMSLLGGVPCPPSPSLLTTFAAAGQAPSLTVTQQCNANRLLFQQWQISSTAGQIGYRFYNRNRENDVTSWGGLTGAGTGTNIFTESNNLNLDSLGRQTLFNAFLNGPPGVTRSQRRQDLNGAQGVPEVRDNANQLVQQVTHSPTHEPMDGLTLHNASPGTGIRTRDTNFVYQWDGLNRLRVVRQRTVPTNIVASYNYDAWPAIHGGRRVQKIVAYSGSLDGTNRFYYDGPNAIEETVVSTNERVARQFLFGRQPDEVLAMDADTNNDGQPDSLQFYLRDHNNNTTQLVNANGTPAEFYFYDYRGRPRFFNATNNAAMTNSAVGNPYLFTGQRYDPETGLYYYKARYYDPTFGVFLSRDPLGFWFDPLNHGNPMALVGNNAWNRRDPSGLGLWSWLMGRGWDEQPPENPPPPKYSDAWVEWQLSEAKQKEKAKIGNAVAEGCYGMAEGGAKTLVLAGDTAAGATLPISCLKATLDVCAGNTTVTKAVVGVVVSDRLGNALQGATGANEMLTGMAAGGATSAATTAIDAAGKK